MDVFLEGKKVRLDPTRSIGKGGEADIFDIGGGAALKVFKPPDHPDLRGNAREQEGARRRLERHQRKLREFPAGLPPHVVTPLKLATDRTGARVVGYTMPIVSGAEVLLRYGNRGFREGRLPSEALLQIFRSLHETVSGIHRARVVIGDFNDLNILVREKEQDAYLIDADSFQFGSYVCEVFTARFVDPLLCDPQGAHLMLVKPHNEQSDWYAYAVMLMQSLLYVGPYGGVYQPKARGKTLSPDARPLKRITVFDPEVRYPKPAVPYHYLPDEVLDYLQRVFKKDHREVFPRLLLDRMRWTRCTSCGVEHARSRCPQCAEAAPAAIREVTRVRGKVTATRLFRTTGAIIDSALQQGKLRWLYQEGDSFMREGGSRIPGISGHLRLRFRLHNETTLVGNADQLVAIKADGSVVRHAVDSSASVPIFDANEHHYYWSENGKLFHDAEHAPQYIGDVLQHQTLFWVGPTFGFGFYRAGRLSVAFVFDVSHRGLNDTVTPPVINGQLIDATSVFSSQRCWFFTTVQEAGQRINRCMVISRTGGLEATAETIAGDGSWLGSIRGCCASGGYLFVPTDEGVVRVVMNEGKVEKDSEYPDTEPFVDSASTLHASKDGIYVVSSKEITLLKLSA